MARKKEQSNTQAELVYVFKNPAIVCRLDYAQYSEKDRAAIQEDLEIMSKEICIDKSYVEYEGTKYDKTFMSEEGWNSLRDLAYKTKFGKKATRREHEILDEAFRTMIICYAYQFFEDAGYDTSTMQFEFPEENYYMYEIHEDTCREWERYPGRWQTWM